ncbi:ice-binding family protein [Pseudolysinimonas sp.]|uniref:ice-binding family protein n=1 Tax=Pseudolysinimonas sp. TaxID=2680009 RepID=UPI003784CD08
MPVGDAWGATIINGPIDLGTSAPFGVLGSTTVTNTGSSVIDGDLGLHPGLSVTGFPPGQLVAGHTQFIADGTASQAQIDLDAAMVTAASLTPTLSGLANLTGMSLTPGVYSGGALSLDAGGILTLAGGPSDVWVFTASSTLTTGSGSQILFDVGGAGPCNVFWRVASSATLGTDSDFAGTIMAEQSITATNGTDVTGRLLAATGAVTLDATDVVVPAVCGTGSVSTDGGPVITSGEPTDATEGTPYAFTVTSTGTPDATYTVTSGALPAGLVLDSTTGEISGTPVAAGPTTFTVTAANGVGSATSAILTLETLELGGSAAAPTALLPPTGAEPGLTAALVAVTLVAVGFAAQRRQSRRAL